MVLNTLSIDPKRVWKGPWRWYNETMLDCCRSLDEIKEKGIEFDQFACLGRCNSLNMGAKRPNQRHIYHNREQKEPIIEEQVDIDDISTSCDTNETKENEDKEDPMKNPLQKKYYTLDEFREDVKLSCVSSRDPVVIVSYSRKGLKQTGDGHFSPIAGYHKDEDMCLIMDVARFKYPPHWVKTKILYDAMCRLDPSCNKTRGWIVTSCAEKTCSYFFTFNTAAINEQNMLDLNDNICCCSSRFIEQIDGNKDEDKNRNKNKNKDQNKDKISCHCAHDKHLSVNRVISCLLECLPSPMNNYIVMQTEKFGIELEEQHEIIKEKILKGIRETGIHKIVQQVFKDDSNKELITRFGNCLNQIEIITLMVLVMGNKDVFDQITDEKISKQLSELSKIDQEKYPELHHEVVALQYQIMHLRQYLLSLYDKTLKDCNGCNH